MADADSFGRTAGRVSACWRQMGARLSVRGFPVLGSVNLWILFTAVHEAVLVDAFTTVNKIHKPRHT